MVSLTDLCGGCIVKTCICVLTNSCTAAFDLQTLRGTRAEQDVRTGRDPTLLCPWENVSRRVGERLVGIMNLHPHTKRHSQNWSTNAKKRATCACSMDNLWGAEELHTQVLLRHTITTRSDEYGWQFKPCQKEAAMMVDISHTFEFV